MKSHKLLNSLLICCLLFTSLVGCSNSDTPTNENSNNSPTTNNDSNQNVNNNSNNYTDLDIDDSYLDDLKEEQLNSIAMLNYLATISEDIYVSKDNRLNLDTIYSSLINQIKPNKIDDETHERIINLLEDIESFSNISTKRDRLQYIYNQDKAANIKNAIPDPLAVLSISNSFNWKQLALSVTYTLVDSYNNYKSSKNELDKEFIISGWELDDEELETINRNRKRTFSYMIDISNEYNLKDEYTLNENAVENFVKYCEVENLYQKIQFLESEQDTYKLLGSYWLELANCYFLNEQYEACLKCLNRYNDLLIDILRKDYNYAEFLPKAIVAVQETTTGTNYVKLIEKYTDDIVENTEVDNWSLRYFAAQSYIDLYSKTDNKSYLKKAYDLIINNVNHLIENQLEINETYLNEVIDIVIEEPDYSYMNDKQKKEAKNKYKEEKESLKKHNKSLKTIRKTELPTLYEPLILNCDLLFALAEELNISTTEKNKIEGILQTKTNGVFLNDTVNQSYSFDKNEEKINVKLTLDGKKLYLPANILTQDSSITAVITNSEKIINIDDFEIKKVTRENNNFDEFIVSLESKTLKSVKWKKNDTIVIKVTSNNEKILNTFSYTLINYKDNFITADLMEFEQTW